MALRSALSACAKGILAERVYTVCPGARREVKVGRMRCVRFHNLSGDVFSGVACVAA